MQQWFGREVGLGLEGVYWQCNCPKGLVYVASESSFATKARLASDLHHKGICCPRYLSTSYFKPSYRGGQVFATYTLIYRQVPENTQKGNYVAAEWLL